MADCLGGEEEIAAMPLWEFGVCGKRSSAVRIVLFAALSHRLPQELEAYAVRWR
jgi:hypothetical protein